MHIKISVIIPVYNVEKYLSECIDSVMHQTYTNIEIILVNDGSTDKSGEICNQYAKKDSRIKVIHTANNGVSQARNTGIENATGDYISFVDSDDWIHENFIEVLYRMCVDNYADIAECEFQSLYTKNETKKTSEVAVQVRAGQEMLHRLYDGDGWHSILPVNKLYKRHLFEALRFPIGKIHEDEFLIWKILYKAKIIAYTPAVLYYYRQTEGSITRSSYNLKRIDKLEALMQRGDFFKKHNWLILYYKNLLTANYFFRENIENIQKLYPAESEILNRLQNEQAEIEKNIKAIEKSEPCINEPYHYRFSPGKYVYTICDDGSIIADLYDITKHCEQVQKLLADQQKLQSQNQKLEQQLQTIQQEKDHVTQHLQDVKTGLSFQIGRIITWLPRKLLGRK